MLIRQLTLILLTFPVCLWLAVPVAEAAPMLQYRHAGDSDPTDPANAPGEVWMVEPGAFASPGALDGGVAQIEIGPLSPDSNCGGCGIAAWGVDDRSTAAGSRYRYLQVPTAAQIADAATEGWTLRAELRIASDEDSQTRAIDPVDAIGLEYNEGPGLNRFLVLFGADDDGDPIVQLGGGDSYTSEGVGNTSYVLYEIVWRPDFQRISVFVDGVERISDGLPLDGSTINPRLHFGSGSSSGQGRAHFALVEWETGLPDGTLGSECDNGLDDDGDGFYDLDDPSCLGDSVGVEQLGTACDNGIDDDGDGWTDLIDPSCLNDLTATTEQLGSVCDNGIDDDGDGTIDVRDAGCAFDVNGLSEGGEFIVNSTADASDANPGDGVCATATAECTLRAAIEETNDLSGTQGVRLPAGSYGLSEGEISILGGVALIAPSGSDDTIIDAGGSSRVIEVRTGAVVTILGATLRGGDSSGGAGLRSESVGDVRIYESAFLENRSTGSGGGIFMQSDSKLLMVDSLVAQNETTSLSSGNGGGVYVWGANGSGTFVRTSFIGNTAAIRGGGIFHILGELILRDSLIQGNLSSASGFGLGSGLSCTNACRLIRTSVEGNAGRGSAVDFNGNVFVISNSTVSGNSRFGSAISAGAGISIGTGWPAARLDHSTVIGNAYTSGTDGDQISGAYIVTNSIIASGGTGMDNCSFSSPIESRGGNFSDDTTCFSADPVAGDQVEVDPMLTRLAKGVAYYPLPGSPVLDAGIGGVCPPFDQLGSARPVDGDFNGSSECDTGAVEFLPEPGMGIGLLLGAAGLVGLARPRRPERHRGRSGKRFSSWAGDRPE